MHVTEVASDLVAEQEALEAVMTELTDEQWGLPTSSDRWSVADQIGHLAYFDGTAAQAIVDPDGFAAARDALISSMGRTPEETDELSLGIFRTLTSAEMMADWQAKRRELADAAATLKDDTRVEWYGPSMGSKSFLTARLMECWAHGQHICDTVGASRPATNRLRHIAQIGFITRGWTYMNRGLEIPEDDVRLALAAPDGSTWTWGPEDASSSVTGDAEDFCLVVTQCRNVADTALMVEGESAIDWLSKAQAFAGAPTDGPAAGEATRP